MTDRPKTSREEIELIYYLRVIWKWKFRILLGTFALAIVVGIISFNMPTVFRVDMVIMPGLLRIDEAGKNTYLDTPENIQALVETGTFDEQILKNIGNADNPEVPNSLRFKIHKPKYSNTLKISYETKNINQGIDILNYLSQLLLAKYEKMVYYFQNEYDTQLKLKQIEIDNLAANIKSSKQIIKNLQERIDQLKSDIDLINKNTNSLIRERDKFLSNHSREDILSSILYTNTIQQNLSLTNTYNNEINKYNSEKEKEKLNLEQFQNSVKDAIESIRNLEVKKNSIQNVQIVQSPIAYPFAVKPKIKLNIMLAAMLGFFTMLFLAFFMEYLFKQKKLE